MFESDFAKIEYIEKNFRVIRSTSYEEVLSQVVQFGMIVRPPIVF